MASTTADRVPAETEPLLGRPGDASQEEGRGLWYNFFVGTGTVAQAGIWILAALVWSAVLMNDVILFSYHPLLNSAGILLLTQGILVLQPTYTQKQKVNGTNVHFALNLLGYLALIAGLIVIEKNKGDHAWGFTSIHGKLGLVTYILMTVQALVGFTQFYTPTLFGSVENAKSIYKYHRISGYAIVILSLATICAATQTGFNTGTLHIQLWAVIVASILVLAGLIPRIKKSKLGF